MYVLGSQFGSTARGNDIVVIKYNSSLTFQWKNLLYNTAYPNNNFNDVPCKLLFDGSSNVYVSGTLANESVPDETTIVVRKYNSSGTVIYTGHVGEPANTTVSNATDMCMDASDNVTVTAKAQNVLLGTPSIMYARVNPSGITSWQKFSSIPTNYSLENDPEIECSTTGIFYLGTSLSREAPANNYYARHMVQKFNNSGTKLWESLTTEINRGANSYMMQLDANENVYSGVILWLRPARLFPTIVSINSIQPERNCGAILHLKTALTCGLKNIQLRLCLLHRKEGILVLLNSGNLTLQMATLFGRRIFPLLIHPDISRATLLYQIYL
ncbi:MAG: hypothetical protein IPJ79_03065 [Bacteroidetes bacterium]|nr:hypothetical protein [Bacteroidota bacterium]